MEIKELKDFSDSISECDNVLRSLKEEIKLKESSVEFYKKKKDELVWKLQDYIETLN